MSSSAITSQLRSRREGGREWATLVGRFSSGGLGHPTLAAAPDEVVVPGRLADAALVNAVATVGEAEARVLWDLGHRVTGTATAAACIVCPDSGPAPAAGGPRSQWGARVATAVHGAVLAGGRFKGAEA